MRKFEKDNPLHIFRARCNKFIMGIRCADSLSNFFSKELAKKSRSSAKRTKQHRALSNSRKENANSAANAETVLQAPKNQSFTAPTLRNNSRSKVKSNDTSAMDSKSRSSSSSSGSGNSTSVTVRNTFSANRSRQKKFYRHFVQISLDEKILEYYSCAFVSDILLQGHLYITPRHFAFYSNVFGYVTKLLIPTDAVTSISREKIARIIPNAVAVSTENERYVFGTLMSRETTFKLMVDVWNNAALQSANLGCLQSDDLPLINGPCGEIMIDPNDDDEDDEDDGCDQEILARISKRCNEGKDSSILCNFDDVSRSSGVENSVATNQAYPCLTRLGSKLTNSTLTMIPDKIRSLLSNGVSPNALLIVLILVLAILYVSAGMMIIRINKLHGLYGQHIPATAAAISSEKLLTQGTTTRLLQQVDAHLQLVATVRQSLEQLSKQFAMLNHVNTAAAAAAAAVQGSTLSKSSNQDKKTSS